MKPYGRFSFVALVVALLSGCGDSGGGEGDADQNPLISSGTPSDAELEKTSVCADEKGDGGAVDLLSANIRIQGEDVLVSAELAGPIPQTGQVWVGFHVQRARDDTSGFTQVAMRWMDGRLGRPYFIHDNFRKRDDLRLSASDVGVEGKTVTMTLPRSMVDDLGDSWVWGAFTIWNGQEGDACPGASGDMKMQPY